MRRSRIKEKRLYPRIAQKIPLKVAADGYGFITATKNVSCIGAYCHIKKYVPPFTKVKIRLTLPVAGTSRKVYHLDCKGVIVRSEDEKKGGFNIAIFFNEINEAQRKTICKYVNQFLPNNPPKLQKRL